jgi:ABC-type sugar transport system ATPase subunit
MKPGSASMYPMLKLTSWSHKGGMFSGINLAIAAGQVTAVVGVEGSGARELVRSVAGLERASGEKSSATGGPNTSVAVEYVGPDRRDELFFNLTLAENVVARLTDSRIKTRFGMLRRSGVRAVGQEWISRFHIRSESGGQPVGSLSGGNQQKVAVASAVAPDPALLVLEEPTRGVDVSSKRDIHELLGNFAQAGHGVLIYSTEIVEAYEAADVVYVMVRGQLAGPLLVPDFKDVEDFASRISSLESMA